MLAFLFHCVALIQDHRLNSSSSSNGLSHQYEDCSGPWEIILIVVHRWRKSFGRLDRQSDQGLPPPAYRTSGKEYHSQAGSTLSQITIVHQRLRPWQLSKGTQSFLICIFFYFLCIFFVFSLYLLCISLYLLCISLYHLCIFFVFPCIFFVFLCISNGNTDDACGSRVWERWSTIEGSIKCQAGAENIRKRYRAIHRYVALYQGRKYIRKRYRAIQRDVALYRGRKYKETSDVGDGKYKRFGRRWRKPPSLPFPAPILSFLCFFYFQPFQRLWWSSNLTRYLSM